MNPMFVCLTQLCHVSLAEFYWREKKCSLKMILITETKKRKIIIIFFFWTFATQDSFIKTFWCKLINNVWLHLSSDRIVFLRNSAGKFYRLIFINDWFILHAVLYNSCHVLSTNTWPWKLQLYLWKAFHWRHTWVICNYCFLYSCTMA